MATTKSVSANAVKNNGGTGVNLGSSTVLSSSSLGLKSPIVGNLVLDNDIADPALDGGVFAYNHQRPVGMRVSTSLATVSNSALTGGADAPALVQSIHKLESIITRKTSTSFRAGQFDIYTGQYTVAPTVSTDTFASDAAANVGYDNKGDLTYMSGSKVPTNVGYKK